MKVAEIHPYLLNLLKLLGLVAFLGFCLAVTIFVLAADADGLFEESICFSNKCFKRFYDMTGPSRAILGFTVDVLMLIGTVGAAVIALLNYLSGVDTARFTNHISHITLFQNYLHSEISKRDALSVSSFDSHRFYSMIFKGSKSGVMSVSSEYIGFIERLNKVISDSNAMAKKADGGSFRYLEHQERMRAVFGEFGFDLQFQPKKDFYEIESQLLSLVATVNESFCSLGAVGAISERLYR